MCSGKTKKNAKFDSRSFSLFDEGKGWGGGGGGVVRTFCMS